MRKIIIPCFYTTEEQVRIEDAGLFVSAKDSVLRDITIYQLPFAICPYDEHNITIGSKVFVGNEYFLTPLLPNEIEDLIDITFDI